MLGAGAEWGCARSTPGHGVGRGDLGLTVGLGFGTGSHEKMLIGIMTVEICLEITLLLNKKSQSSFTPQLLSTYHASSHPWGQQVRHGGPGGSQGFSPCHGSKVYSLGAGKDHV